MKKKDWSVTLPDGTIVSRRSFVVITDDEMCGNNVGTVTVVRELVNPVFNGGALVTCDAIDPDDNMPMRDPYYEGTKYMRVATSEEIVSNYYKNGRRRKCVK